MFPPRYQSSGNGAGGGTLSLDPESLDADQRLVHRWLTGYRIAGATLLRLLGYRAEAGVLVDTGRRLDPARVIGLTLEVETEFRAGEIPAGKETGRLVTRLQGEVAPWPKTQRFVRRLLDEGEDLYGDDFAALLDNLVDRLESCERWGFDGAAPEVADFQSADFQAAEEDEYA